MSNNQVEKALVEQNLEASFYELGNYMEKCLEGLLNGSSAVNVPFNKATYSELTQLLKRKIEDKSYEDTVKSTKQLKAIDDVLQKLKSLELSSGMPILPDLILLITLIIKILRAGLINNDEDLTDSLKTNINSLRDEIILQRINSESKLSFLLGSKSYQSGSSSEKLEKYLKKKAEISKIYHLLNPIEVELTKNTNLCFGFLKKLSKYLEIDFPPSLRRKSDELVNDFKVNSLGSFFTLERRIATLENALFSYGVQINENTQTIFNLHKLHKQFVEDFASSLESFIPYIEEFVKRKKFRYKKELKTDVELLISEIEFELKKIQINLLNKETSQRHKFVEALKEKIEVFFENLEQSLEIKKLPWKLLPKGEWTVEDIVREIKKYSSKQSNLRDSDIDETRLRKIRNNLKPNACYIGEEEFQGYVVFCFNWTKKIVLECPKFGNAIYIIKDNWQEITKLSKWEARHQHSDQVTRIIHNDTWFERLEVELKS